MFVSQLAFPNDQDVPSRVYKRPEVLPVTHPIALKLRKPIRLVTLWFAQAFGTIMYMPEATMNEDRQLPSDPREVRFAGQVFSVQPIASEPKVTNNSSDDELRSCVLAADAPHVA